jgi:thioredoxin 1
MTRLVEVNDHNFDAQVLKSDLIVITLFWAEWNAASRKLMPILEEVSREFNSQTKIATLDIDANPVASSNYSVLQVPTLIFFKNCLPVEQMVGSATKEQIVAKFDSYLVKE